MSGLTEKNKEMIERVAEACLHGDTNIMSNALQEQSHRAKLVAKKIEEMKEFIATNSGSFEPEVQALTKRKGYNKVTFCARTMLSCKTYERIWNNAMRCIPKPETVMQICLGLNLGIEYGEPLFEKAGYKLDGSDILLAYRVILIEYSQIDIYECNEILEQLGLSTLAKRFLKKSSN